MAAPKRTAQTQMDSRLVKILAVLEARTKLLAFFFGLCFVTALLVLAICLPDPTAFQYTVFRIVLALAAAGVAGVIPGMIRLKVQPGTALLIHAGGALAVFVMVYLLAPAALTKEQPAPPPSPSPPEKPPVVSQPLKISNVDAIENGVYILNLSPPEAVRFARVSNLGDASVHISLIGFPEKYFYTNFEHEKSLLQGHADKNMFVVLLPTFFESEQKEYFFEVQDSAGGAAKIAIRIDDGWPEYIAQQIKKIDEKYAQGASVAELYQAAKGIISASGYKELASPLQEVFIGQLLEAAKQPEAAAVAYSKAEKETSHIVKRLLYSSSSNSMQTQALSVAYKIGSKFIIDKLWKDIDVKRNKSCYSCSSYEEAICPARKIIECNDALIQFFAHPTVEHICCYFNGKIDVSTGFSLRYTFRWKKDNGEKNYDVFDFQFNNKGELFNINPIEKTSFIPPFIFYKSLSYGDIPDVLLNEMLRGTTINNVNVKKMITDGDFKKALILILRERQK